MDDLAQSWRKLTLSDREGPGCLTADENFSIAAKFLTKRAINVDIIARTFTPLWRVQNGFKIKVIGDHKILFSFEKKKDVDRIMSSEPWSFDKHLVIMHRYENEGPLQEIKFDRTVFWVQIHGVPMRYMTIEAVEKICSTVGKVIRPTDPRVYDGGSFLCIQVSIDLILPLCRGLLVSLNKDKQVWISFKYERLPNLCYWCGRLTHDDKDCDLWIESEGTLQAEQREFGSHLRAAPFSMSRKNIIAVPGYYSTRKTTNTEASTES
ncbi:uncharacterized protein LOC115981364 [Quercus lobata]|uniref:uncharacterized protein LOC115981364 n=1 Tax=Quercus lobata TaxID=97700 RepID=UPI001244AFDB|nr:uncharacterized protein LOC115981364 [Quercus lobata]